MAKSLQVNQVGDAFVTVPGFYYIEESQQGVDVTIDSTAWKQFQPTTGTHSIEIPVAGPYKFGLAIHVLPNTALASYQFKIILNEGQLSEIVVGGDLAWTVRINDIGQYQAITFVGFADLPAGTHTYTVEGKRVDGSGTLTLYSQSALFRQPQVIVEAVSGSGAAGLIVARSSASGNTNITATHPVWQDISVETIEVIEGEHVSINVSGFGRSNSGVDTQTRVRLYDATTDKRLSEVYGYSYELADYNNITMAIVTDGLSAGTHVIKFQATKSSYEWTLNVWDMSVTRYRGGLIPYKQDGLSKITAPRSVNVIAPLKVEDMAGEATLSWLGSGSDGIIAKRTPQVNFKILDAYIHGAAPYTVQSETIQTREGERVHIGYTGYFRHLEAGLVQPYVDLLIDGNIVTGVSDQEGTQYNYGNMSFSYVTDALAAGEHTISIELSKYQTSNSDPTMYKNELYIMQYRGGYSTPQNLPLIDSVSGNTFNMVAAAGANSELWIPMNNGSMLRATAPYAMDVSTNGAGGLEGSLTATASTTYFVYAVPHPTSAGEAIFIASDKDPAPNSDNGPANYPVWAYCGFLFYRSTSDLRPVHQEGANFHFADPTEDALQIYYGSVVDPPQNTWYTFSTASAAGGVGTQRDISAALPMGVVDSIDLQAGCDSDAGDQIAFYVDAREVAWSTPSNWKNLGVVMFHLDNSQRAVSNRQNIPVHNSDVKFLWSGIVGSLFDWSMSVRGYTDKYLTGRGVGQAGVLRNTERIDNTDNTSAFTAMVGINRVDISLGSFTATLPTAASASGQTVKFLVTDMDPQYELTVDGDGAETIDGSAQVYLQAQAMSEFYSDGTAWHWLKKGQKYVSRGDIASVDFSAFTEDNVYYSLDISSKIPNAAYGSVVSFYAAITAGVTFQLATTGTPGQNISRIDSGEGAFVECTSAGAIYYKISASSAQTDLSVRGWWVDV